MVNIQLNKKLYGAKAAGDIVDKSFSELFKTKEPINLNRLFRIYNELFYDIPKLGEKSHTTFIQKSLDYIRDYIDPKDAEIDALIDRIEILEEELANNNEQEHPFFSNGSFVSSDLNGAIFLMEEGRKRSIKGWPLVQTLLTIMGKGGQMQEEQFIMLQPSTIDGIPSGPNIESEGDLNNYDYTIPSKTQDFFALQTSLNALNLTEGQLIQLRNLLDDKEKSGVIGQANVIGQVNLRPTKTTTPGTSFTALGT
jgi:hypothetical protein